MANLTKEVAKRIILSREIVTGQHSQTVDLTVSSVNAHDGKHIVNFKGATEKQYANAITLFRDGDIDAAGYRPAIRLSQPAKPPPQATGYPARYK